jgi:hypothetical protein
MTFLAQVQDGKISFGTDYNRARFVEKAKKVGNPARIRIEFLSPESQGQRKFYHGAVLTLWAFLNGWDYKDSDVLDFLHNEAKNEFNGEIVILDGIKKKRGKSTKGELNHGYLERLIDHLEDQYGIDRRKVLNPNHYKDFRDRIYMEGKYDTYIDYLLDLRLLVLP